VLLPTIYPDGGAQLRHLRLHNGTIWRWNRLLLGFDGAVPSLRVEHRVMPAGPTVPDMLANAAVYPGATRRLAGLHSPPESRLPFETARDNLYRAARDGLAARLVWIDGREVDVRALLAEQILPMASDGLELLGIDGADVRCYLEIAGARVRLGQNGATWQRAFVERHGTDPSRLLARYMSLQRSGLPVHEWPVQQAGPAC
jgi:gamma-glutamyl:cysteine ligase YbdK (ATP-grasp superfamily)